MFQELFHVFWGKLKEEGVSSLYLNVPNNFSFQVTNAKESNTLRDIKDPTTASFHILIVEDATQLKGLIQSAMNL